MIVLYILMRTDLDSMNPGKAMAQSSHAYGAMKKAVRSNLPMQEKYREWIDSTEQEFGTTLVLGGSEGKIRTAMVKAGYQPNVITGWVHDPSYPITDGAVVHHIPLNTCAFIFGTKEDCRPVVAGMELHS